MRKLSKLLFVFISLSICSVEAQQTTDPKVSTPAIRALESERYSEYSNLTTLPELAILPENSSKQLIVTAHSSRPQHNRIGGASTDPNAWLQELIGNSDVVLIGRPYNRVSSLTSEKTFVFSDYEFTVETIIKDKLKHISVGSQIIVSRAGGVVTYEGRTFRAIDPEFQMFRLGDLYLLFMYRLPETGTYMVTADRAFSLRYGNLTSAKTHPEHTMEGIAMPLIQGYATKEGLGK